MYRNKRTAGFFLIVCMMLMCSLVGCSEEVVVETVKSSEGEALENPGIEKEKEQVIYVHVCGAVKRPGLYELEPGKRVAHAVEAAGGLCEDASEESLNMARELVDGEQILVLTQEEITRSVENAAVKKDGRININTAGVSELVTLNGIGETKAEAIVTYREEQGQFQRIEDICNVDGIGEGTFKKIQDSITIN